MQEAREGLTLESLLLHNGWVHAGHPCSAWPRVNSCTRKFPLLLCCFCEVKTSSLNWTLEYDLKMTSFRCGPQKVVQELQVIQGYNDTTLLHVQEIVQKYSYIILWRNTHKPRGTTMVFGQHAWTHWASYHFVKSVKHTKTHPVFSSWHNNNKLPRLVIWRQ